MWHLRLYMITGITWDFVSLLCLKRKRHCIKNHFQELSLKNHILCNILKKIIFSKYCNILSILLSKLVKVVRNEQTLIGRFFYIKYFPFSVNNYFLWCPLSSPQKVATTAFYSSGSTEEHRLIKTKVVYTILFRVFNFSVPSPFDNK